MIVGLTEWHFQHNLVKNKLNLLCLKSAAAYSLQMHICKSYHKHTSGTFVQPTLYISIISNNQD